MHLKLYDYYTRFKYWYWADGSSAEYLILGGQFLLEVQGQSEQLQFYKDVDEVLEMDARIMFRGLKGDEKDTFSGRGSRVITADLLTSPNVRLALQLYTVHWEANCWIGPKKCNVEMPECKDDKCGSKAAYGCDISWTLYDYYDFRWWEPHAYLGHPFHIYGYWEKPATGGTITSCQNE